MDVRKAPASRGPTNWPTPLDMVYRLIILPLILLGKMSAAMVVMATGVM